MWLCLCCCTCFLCPPFIYLLMSMVPYHCVYFTLFHICSLTSTVAIMYKQYHSFCIFVAEERYFFNFHWNP
uniref:Uncharacterized protein n=1 Tax=Arundo donax TaxID=35708 RepID=A0A0A9GJN3_ARUDO